MDVKKCRKSENLKKGAKKKELNSALFIKSGQI
jgi:hypothetical protein